MQRRFMCIFGAVLGLAFLASQALGQQQPGTITATGTGVIHVQPSAIGLSMVITADGKTAKEALEKLQERRDHSKAKLKELGAQPGSIEFTTATISSGSQPSGPGCAPSIWPMPSQAPSGPNAGQAAAVLHPVTAALAQPARESTFMAGVAVTAKWPLAEMKPDARVLFCESLRAKLVAAKLCGNGSPQSILAYPAPVPTTAYYLPHPYCSAGPPDPNSPYQLDLSYVGVVSQSDRKAALADAVAQAKVQATALADAVSCRVGALVSVSSDTQGENPAGSYCPPGYACCHTGGECEVSSPIPDAIDEPVSVTLQYQIVK